MLVTIPQAVVRDCRLRGAKVEAKRIQGYDTASGSKGLSTEKFTKEDAMRMIVTIPQAVVKACQQ